MYILTLYIQKLEINGFEWDAHNIAHIVRHQVVPSEVEELFNRMRITEEAKPRASGKEKRFIAYGTTAHRRYLAVIFTYLRSGVVRTVTAYPMNRSTRKRYASKLKS